MDEKWTRKLADAWMLRSLALRRSLSRQASRPLPPLLASPRRALCAAAPPRDPAAPVRIYRLQQIALLRALLRVKVLQLGGGVAVLLPSATVISNGGLPSLAEGGLVAAIVGGTLIAGTTLSWYMERVVGELAWLPARKALRVSTLTMWGERHDRELELDELLADGLSPPSPPPPLDGDPVDDAYPTPGFAPLELCGKTYVCVWDARHVQQVEACARLLKRSELPFDPDDCAEATMQTPQPARTTAAGSMNDSAGRVPAHRPPASAGEDQVRFF